MPRVRKTDDRPGSAVLVCASVAAFVAVLMLLGWATVPSRHIPAQDELEVARGPVERVTERCEGSGSVAVYPLTCYWTVVIGGRRLGWPWVDPDGRPDKTEGYLQRHGPVTVWLDGDTIYQIALKDGYVYLPYANAADATSDQHTRLTIGWITLGALSVVKVGMELLYGCQRREHDGRLGGSPHPFAVACLLYLGAALTLYSLPNPWWVILAMALFAVGLGLVRQPLRRLLVGEAPR